MKLVTTLFFCVLALLGNAQRKQKAKKPPPLSTTELSIQKIDSSVRSISTDTNLVSLTVPSLSKELQTIFPYKKTARLPAQDTPYTTIKAFWLNGKLCKLEVYKTNANGQIPFSKTYQLVAIYFLNNKPVLLQQDFYSEQIMGSCGEVSASFYHYFNDSTSFAGQQTGSTEGYAMCYGWTLQKPDAAAFFKQVNELRNLLAVKAPTQLPPAKNKIYLHPILSKFYFKIPKTEIVKYYGY